MILVDNIDVVITIKCVLSICKKNKFSSSKI